MVYQVIYSSESTEPMASDELEEILEQARASNATQGITGALIYAEGHFLQVLEGDKARVQALMTKITRDPRHQAVKVLREGDVAAATFGSWNMAYISATPEQIAEWAGLSMPTASPDTLYDTALETRRMAQFAQDILALLGPDPAPHGKGD